MTSYKLNAIGLPYHQDSWVRNTENTDGYDDSIDTKYVAHDTDKVIKISGTRRRVKGGTSQSEIRIGLDPNGNTELILEPNKEPIQFITNSSNRTIEKTVGKDQEEHYFYITSDDLIGRFSNIPVELFKGQLFIAKKDLTKIDFDLIFHPVSEHFPAPIPDQCLVMAGDNFASISERMYGDRSFANLIADANGYQEGKRPQVGLTLQVPSTPNTNIHNWEGIYSLYNQAAIIGSLYPNMPIPQRTMVMAPQRRHRHHFWHILVEAIVGTAIMAFAPGLAASFAGVLGEIIGQALGFAIAGAASNLAQQELAIAFGDQEKLSLSSIGQSALLAAGTAGIAKGIGIDLTKAPQYNKLVESAIKNVELTIASQALSFAIGQQKHFDWKIMVGSLISTLANVGVKHYGLGGAEFNDTLATTSGTVASIGVDKLFHGNMSIEAIAANTLGTMVGNQLAARVKQYHAEYQLKKEREVVYKQMKAHYRQESQHHKSQIPEISQSLKQSEKEFIQGVLRHPHDYGKSFSSPTSKSREQIASEFLKDVISDGREFINDATTKISKGIKSFNSDFHLTELASNMRFGMPESLSDRISASLPGTYWGDQAAQYWATKQIQTGNPLYAIPGMAASLWTPTTAFDTVLTLGPDVVLGLGSAAIRTAPVVSNFASKSVSRVSEYSGSLFGRGRMSDVSKTNNVQFRVDRMMEKNVAYNVSPEAWFQEFDAIGRYGTYVTDYRAIAEKIGPIKANAKLNVGFFSKGNQLSYYKVRRLETTLGLEPYTLTDGFRLTRVSQIMERNPRSPISGNDYFLGPGKGLPGGGPEMVIDSIPTKPWW